MIRDGGRAATAGVMGIEALARTASEFRADPGTSYGRDARWPSGALDRSTRREFYTLGSSSAADSGTNNYDGNTTLSMASAVSGYKRSFGSDGPPGCYDDFDRTECLIAYGPNLSECHPVSSATGSRRPWQGRRFPVIVVDPRVTMLAQLADIHLPIRPGTDVVLLNALANVILAEGMEDQAFAWRNDRLRRRCRTVSRFTPEYAEWITGIPAGRIREVARIYGRAGAAMAIWTMGTQPVHARLRTASRGAINNLALITGERGEAGRIVPLDHRAVQRHGDAGVLVRLRPPRVPPARKPRASFGDRPVLGRGRDVFPKSAASP